MEYVKGGRDNLEANDVACFVHAQGYQRYYLVLFAKLQLLGKKSELVRLSVSMWSSIVGSIVQVVGSAKLSVVGITGMSRPF